MLNESPFLSLATPFETRNPARNFRWGFLLIYPLTDIKIAYPKPIARSRFEGIGRRRLYMKIPRANRGNSYFNQFFMGKSSWGKWVRNPGTGSDQIKSLEIKWKYPFWGLKMAS
jgi:hypothetical protein